MPVLNPDKIANEFDIDLDDVTNNLQDLRDKLDACKDIEDPSKILQSNIERASRLLDLLEDAISRGAVEARLFEVAAQLINVSTQTANSMVNNSIGFENVRLKEEGLVIKEKEIDLKEQGLKHKMSLNTPVDPADQTTNSSIKGTREELMKMFKDEGALQ